MAETSGEVRDDYAVIKLGDDSKKWFPMVQEYTIRIIANKVPRVAFVYEGIDALHSGGIASLIFVYEQLRKNGVDITNCNMSDSQKRHILIKGTDYLVHTKESRLEDFLNENA